MNIHNRVHLQHVELLTEQHVIDGCALANMMYNEMRPAYTYDGDKVRQTGMHIIRDPDRSFENSWLVYHGHVPIGIAYGFCYSPIFSQDQYGTMNFWFVRPDYRKTFAAYLLLRGFERWAKLNGAVEVLVGATNDHDVAAADGLNRLFDRRDYKRVGAWYSKRTVKD